MADDDNIKVEVEIPRWCAEALDRWAAPAEYVGDTLAEKLACLAQDQADRFIAEWDKRAQEGGAELRQIEAEHNEAMDALYRPKRLQ